MPNPVRHTRVWKQTRRRAPAIVVACALALVAAADARAEEPAPRVEVEIREHASAKLTIDPVTDAAIVSVALGFGALSELVVTTGEIVPQQPQPSSRLLAIDRLALTKHEDSAGPTSTIAIAAMLGFSAIDSIITGYRDGLNCGVVDAVLYAEALALTWAATNLAKLTVRRPRPLAYQEQQRLYDEFGVEEAPNITETDTALSFFSGHTALAAAVTSTATYLAFVRSPDTARPWFTLAAGVVLTAFVGVQRVRAGAHFPTDVIAGAMAGAGIGVLVPHLHRDEPTRQSLWIGFMQEEGGGTVAVSGPLTL